MGASRTGATWSAPVAFSGVVLILIGLVSPALASTPAAVLAGGTSPAIFVSSYSNGTITRIDLISYEQTVVLSGLYQPEGGTCDRNGTLYFALPASNEILRFAQNGTGLATEVYVPGLEPEGPSLAPNGDLFFTTRRGLNGAVWRIPGATPMATPQQATAVFAQFSEGTAFTAEGHLLAVDTYRAQLDEFAPPFGPNNTGRVFASGTPYWNGVAVSQSGDVYVADGTGGEILHLDAAGHYIGNITGLRYPEFLAFDDQGNLYVTDFVYQPYPGQMDTVVRISHTGVRTTIADLRGALGIAVCGLSPTGNGPTTFLGSPFGTLLFVALIMAVAGAVFGVMSYAVLRPKRIRPPE